MSETRGKIEKACQEHGLSVEEFENLLSKSQDAQPLAYCPYSNFHVGAVLLTNTGDYILGGNIENASYPVTICAERVALGNAVSSGFRKYGTIKAVGVATDLSTPCSPCGACRQALIEFCEPIMPIIMLGRGGAEPVWVVKTLGELLPMSFGPSVLPPPEQLPDYTQQ